MNKIATALLIAAGIGMSFGVHAQVNLNDGGATIIGPAGSTTADEECVLLGENVTLNLSRAVHGAFQCDEATNAIKISTCHETGSRKPTVVNCTAQGEAPNITYTPSGCTADTPNIEIADYRGFTANSRGGGVGYGDLGGKCEDGSVAALIAD
jgi:hypothetical protein